MAVLCTCRLVRYLFFFSEVRQCAFFVVDSCGFETTGFCMLFCFCCSQIEMLVFTRSDALPASCLAIGCCKMRFAQNENSIRLAYYPAYKEGYHGARVSSQKFDRVSFHLSYQINGCSCAHALCGRHVLGWSSRHGPDTLMQLSFGFLHDELRQEPLPGQMRYGEHTDYTGTG